MPASIDSEAQLTVHCDRLKEGAGDWMVMLDGTQNISRRSIINGFTMHVYTFVVLICRGIFLKWEKL